MTTRFDPSFRQALGLPSSYAEYFSGKKTAAVATPFPAQSAEPEFEEVDPLYFFDQRRVASVKIAHPHYRKAGTGFYRCAHAIWELRPAEDDGGGYVLVRKREERHADFRVASVRSVQACCCGMQSSLALPLMQMLLSQGVQSHNHQEPLVELPSEPPALDIPAPGEPVADATPPQQITIQIHNHLPEQAVETAADADCTVCESGHASVDELAPGEPLEAQPVPGGQDYMETESDEGGIAGWRTLVNDLFSGNCESCGEPNSVCACTDSASGDCGLESETEFCDGCSLPTDRCMCGGGDGGGDQSDDASFEEYNQEGRETPDNQEDSESEAPESDEHEKVAVNFDQRSWGAVIMPTRAFYPILHGGDVHIDIEDYFELQGVFSPEQGDRLHGVPVRSVKGPRYALQNLKNSDTVFVTEFELDRFFEQTNEDDFSRDDSDLEMPGDSAPLGEQAPRAATASNKTAKPWAQTYVAVQAFYPVLHGGSERVDPDDRSVYTLQGMFQPGSDEFYGVSAPQAKGTRVRLVDDAGKTVIVTEQELDRFFDEGSDSAEETRPSLDPVPMRSLDAPDLTPTPSLALSRAPSSGRSTVPAR